MWCRRAQGTLPFKKSISSTNNGFRNTCSEVLCAFPKGTFPSEHEPSTWLWTRGLQLCLEWKYSIVTCLWFSVGMNCWLALAENGSAVNSCPQANASVEAVSGSDSRKLSRKNQIPWEIIRWAPLSLPNYTCPQAESL